jgi:hypothetical protein
MIDLAKEVVKDVTLAYEIRREGTPFFDFIDQRLTREVYFEHLEQMSRWDTDGFIVSGKFGWAYSMWYRGEKPVHVFPGNLRHDKLIDPGVVPPLKGRSFTFLDNSIYKGRTLDQIEQYVDFWSGYIERKFVIYDGSKPPHHKGIEYLYRWHDLPGGELRLRL